MKKMTKRQFTLIEMMIVMAIIGILASILFPTVMAIRDKAKARETQTLVSSISVAITQFRGEYNYLPSPGDTPGKDETYGKFNKNDLTEKPSSDYCEFFNVLTYSNYASKNGGPSDKAEEINTKGIAFLTVPNSYFSDSDRECNMRDSWSQPLVVKLDYDGDEKIEISSSDVSTSVNWNFKADSVVISAGKQVDGELSKDEFIGSPALK